MSGVPFCRTGNLPVVRVLTHDERYAAHTVIASATMSVFDEKDRSAFADSTCGRSSRRSATMGRLPMRQQGAFTLVEVLAALLLIAIILPVVMQGISLATNLASDARRRTEAAGLAESKLGEIIATRQWLVGSLSGDFTPDWPDYRWEASLQPYANDSSGKGVQQIDLRVIWTARNREQSVAVSTLAYARTTTSE